MKFMDLPLVLAQDILKHVVAEELNVVDVEEMEDLFRLRTVNRFFNHEVVKNLGRYRFENFVRYRNRDQRWKRQRLQCPTAVPFQVRLLYERVRKPSPRFNLRYFPAVFNNVADELVRLFAKLGIPADRDDLVCVICETVIDLRGLEFSQTLGYVGPDPYQGSVNNRTVDVHVFLVATAVPYLDICRLMLKEIHQPLISGNIYLGQPLGNAIQRRNYEVVELLLNQEEVKYFNHWLLSYFLDAARTDDLEIFRLFLTSKWGIEDNRAVIRRAALTATRSGHADLVQLALEHHPDIYPRFRKQLCLAAAKYGCDTILLRYLSPEDDVSNLLREGITEGRIPVSTASILLEKGAQICRPGTNKHNCFHFAIQRGRADLVELFLENGVDLENDYNSKGIHPLRYCRPGSSAVLQTLLDHGLDVYTPEAREILRCWLRKIEYEIENPRMLGSWKMRRFLKRLNDFGKKERAEPVPWLRQILGTRPQSD